VNIFVLERNMIY